jgi:uncharacterized protein
MTDRVKVARVDCPDWPVQALGAAISDGDPKASGKVTFQSDDKLVSGGVWACSEGAFDLSFGWDEMAYLLEGELVIQEASGEQLQVKPGDFFFSPRGTKSRWIIKKTIKKVFFLRSPHPLG